jgi:hypothetical protein
MTAYLFCQPPAHTITGKDDLAAALADPDFVCDVHTRVEATYLFDLISEIITTTNDTAYNASVYALACERLNLSYAPYHSQDKNETLGWLVYWAQEFRRNHRDVAAGYRPLTQAMIQEAYQRKAKLEVKGDWQNHIYNPRLISGKYYAMKPGARNHYLAIYPDTQARIIDR